MRFVVIEVTGNIACADLFAFGSDRYFLELRQCVFQSRRPRSISSLLFMPEFCCFDYRTNLPGKLASRSKVARGRPRSLELDCRYQAITLRTPVPACSWRNGDVTPTISERQVPSCRLYEKVNSGIDNLRAGIIFRVLRLDGFDYR